MIIKGIERCSDAELEETIVFYTEKVAFLKEHKRGLWDDMEIHHIEAFLGAVQAEQGRREVAQGVEEHLAPLFDEIYERLAPQYDGGFSAARREMAPEAIRPLVVAIVTEMLERVIGPGQRGEGDDGQA